MTIRFYLLLAVAVSVFQRAWQHIKHLLRRRRPSGRHLEQALDDQWADQLHRMRDTRKGDNGIAAWLTAPLNLPGPDGARRRAASEPAMAVMPAAAADEQLYPLEMTRVAVARAGEPDLEIHHPRQGGHSHHLQPYINQAWDTVTTREHAYQAMGYWTPHHQPAYPADKLDQLIARVLPVDELPHLQRTWADDTGSFRALTGLAS
jgi:hypothetical protein